MNDKVTKNKPSKFLILGLAEGEYRFCNTADDVIEQIDEFMCENDYDYIEDNIKVFGITQEYEVKYGKAYLVEKKQTKQGTELQ